VNKFIKIGRTTDTIKNRLASNQVSNPNLLCVLAVIDDEDDDRIYHAQFKHCHHRGEWFRPTADLLEFIHSLPRVDIKSLLSNRDTELMKRYKRDVQRRAYQPTQSEVDASVQAAFERMFAVDKIED
jgi:hypothetical protein